MTKTSIGTWERRPAARIASASPMRRNISIVRALQRSILGRNWGVSFRSMSSQRMPLRPRSMASVKPTGPAPTMMTCVSNSRPRSQREHPLGIQLKELLLVRLAQGQLVLDPHLFRYVLVWVIHRVHHSVRADQRVHEHDRGLPGHTARRDVEVLPEIIARPLLQLLRHDRELGAVHVVDAIQPERDGFAQMTDDDLKPWEAIERAADDDPQHVQARFHREAINGSLEATFVKWSNHRRR